MRNLSPHFTVLLYISNGHLAMKTPSFLEKQMWSSDQVVHTASGSVTFWGVLLTPASLRLRAGLKLES